MVGWSGFFFPVLQIKLVRKISNFIDLIPVFVLCSKLNSFSSCMKVSLIFCLSTIIKCILIVFFLSNVFVYLLQIDGWEKLRKWAAASVVVYGACAASLVASLTCLKSHVDRPPSKNGEGDIRRLFHLSRLTQKRGARLSQ